MLSARNILQNCSRGFRTSAKIMASLRVAIIGQSQFGMDVYKNLRAKGHEIVGVFTIPDVKGKPDILASEAEKDGLQVFKFKRWRNKGEQNSIAEVFEQYKSCNAELNVLPFCSQFIPMDVIDSPKHGSIIYHPSLLPKHRGASAINWTLMEGDKQGGFTIFWADDGLDTGPILLQKSIDIDPNDTVDTLYNRFLYPEGIKGMVEAVDLISDGKAPRIVQPEEGASYDKIWKKKEVAKINWNQPAERLHNFIRGNDKLPGAWSMIDGEQITFYSSLLEEGSSPAEGTSVAVEGLEKPGIVHSSGMTLIGNDGKMLTVKALGLADGKMIPASRFGQSLEETEALELSEEEQALEESIKNIWVGILSNPDIDNSTDFFGAGAGSMDVARLVEEVKEKCNISLETEDVYMNTGFTDFVRMVVMNSRGSGQEEFKVDTIDMNINNMEIRMPHQAFINGTFVDSTSGKTFHTVNPDDETVLGEITYCSPEDVDLAVAAAQDAFVKGPWGRMNARDRGALLYRLADVMDEHRQELATIESLDAGAVYTLALKTHVGMSIDTFRYYAGWCDKIQGTTIPINHSRPSKNLTYTKREPFGYGTTRAFLRVYSFHPFMSGSLRRLPITTKIACRWTEDNIKLSNNNTGLATSYPGSSGHYKVDVFDDLDRVCALIVPWNYPLMMLAWKMAPLLAAGNTVVLKPAQVTPMTALKFGELTVKAGFPPGVINILPGSGSLIGNYMCQHPNISKVGFTGSTPVGKIIMSNCSPSLKRVQLELGGKSPLIIFSDCDLERAVRQGLMACFFNKGENCIAAGRLFVEESIHDEFVQKVINEVKKMKIGNPLDRSTDHGPQNHKSHLDSLLSYVEKGVAEGATLVYGGKRLDRPGWYMEPAVFTDVKDGTFIAEEESFGPIMVISKFANGDIDDVIRRANATQYGLASGVFTKDLSKALRVSDGLEAGTCFVNCYNKTDVAAPFGGFKQSGFGKDLGEEALNEYLRTKVVTIEY